MRIVVRRAVVAFFLSMSLFASASPIPGFAFSTTVVPATTAGYEVVRLFAKLTPDPNAGQPFFGATGIESINGTIKSSGVLVFFFPDTGLVGALEWSPIGANASDSAGRLNNSTESGSFIRPGSPTAGSIIVDLTTPPAYTENSPPDPPVDINPFASLTSFQVVAHHPTGTATEAVSDDQGSLIARAIVPTGSNVEFFGSVQADAGPAVPFDLSVPEPSGIGSLGLGSLLLVRRIRSGKQSCASQSDFNIEGSHPSLLPEYREKE